MIDTGLTNRGNHTMEKRINPLKNEQGYFLILATIMLLALLTIISIAASNTASTEVQIAGNDTLYQRNLYLAEGAAMEAVDRLQNDPAPRTLAFVHRRSQRRWIPAGKPVSGSVTRGRLRGIRWVWVSPGCMDLLFTAAPKNRA
jgi:Tfp pilus assembly protein PilX